MTVQQISVFIENRAGKLAQATAALGKAEVNIRALSLAETSDFGILRLIVDRTDVAKKALTEEGFTVDKTDVVAVQVPDRPMGLAHILHILDEAKITVEYLYAFVERCGDHAVIIFRFDDSEQAIAALTSNDVEVLSAEAVYSM
ncbi:amino acid-binding protein [Syntrophotalea acetylenivorans]|uniref:Amino acid-binding protein n=1 Tax=Syntrophotalea acetylenivorans TaxID=1842532 RepID=A0A1L3GLX9_9BACT|nr:amino acid-binding protein [Syntrophotalea acetylenivorans]APG26901.1 amino acid-binding protein [Syntrophotalea acetylenivorans]